MKSINSMMRPLRQAMAASFLINTAMILLPILGGRSGIHAVLVKTSDVIAAPAGLFVDAFAPRQHTTEAFALAAVESLVVSFLVYALVLWCFDKIIIRFELNNGHSKSHP
jgi:hypothetical protein